ncbi:hypothetical protein KL864_27030 [Mycolicibacterium goodii]|uniref:hypothetical protein n=1 Tax=Mycolicibacterium goodii TaxID=134601 RepID=UPI001BDC606E|nr:hypothetical protein [Mycolicibacterium goodii]MBU8819544.1 hypothetical protein [Mycolicibacterium goodii]
MSKLVLIEYTENVESVAGRADEDEKKAAFEPGTRRRVDAASAASLVKKGVAKRVKDSEPAPAADAASAKPAKSTARTPVESGGGD